jgi:hypothetical protein
VRAKPLITQMRRGRLPAFSRRHVRVDGLQRLSGRNTYPSGITRSNIMSPAHTTGPRTKVRLGARAHNTHHTNRAHAPPTHAAVQPQKPRTTRLPRGPYTCKEKRARLHPGTPLAPSPRQSPPSGGGPSHAHIARTSGHPASGDHASRPQQQLEARHAPPGPTSVGHELRSPSVLERR